MPSGSYQAMPSGIAQGMNSQARLQALRARSDFFRSLLRRLRTRSRRATPACASQKTFVLSDLPRYPAVWKACGELHCLPAYSGRRLRQRQGNQISHERSSAVERLQGEPSKKPRGHDNDERANAAYIYVTGNGLVRLIHADEPKPGNLRAKSSR